MSVRKRTWTTRKDEVRTAWVVDYVDRQGDRHIQTFSLKKDAVARHDEVKVDVRSGVHVAASKSLTVSEAGEIWIKAGELDGLEAGTLLQYRGHLKHILPALGRVKLSDLTTADVATLSDTLRKGGMSPVMTNKVLVSLGSLIGEAQSRNLVARNVVREGRRKKHNGDARHKRKLKIGADIPEPEEITAILANAKDRWRPLLLIAAFTGVCTENLNPDVVVMKSAKDRM